MKQFPTGTPNSFLQFRDCKAEQTSDSELFRYYGSKWAESLGIPVPVADEEWTDLWNRLDNSNLESFNNKLVLKTSRWFNLHENIQKQKSEIWIFKMLLKYFHKTPLANETFIDPFENAVNNPRRELARMRSGSDGDQGGQRTLSNNIFEIII